VKSLHMFIFNIHYTSSTKKWITVINITVHIISMLYESYLLIYTCLVIIIDNQQDFIQIHLQDCVMKAYQCRILSRLSNSSYMYLFVPKTYAIALVVIP